MSRDLTKASKPVVPPTLGDDDLKLLRRIQVIIDSCVGVLQSPNFLDFDKQLPNEELSDLSHLLYHSFPTLKNASNDIALENYLFRSSTFSLFGHVIFNSQTFINYTKKINKACNFAILHVITGTPGMGKTASRFPFITLLMSHGVESVTTAKNGEQVYVFKRREDTTKTGKATISMDDGTGTLPDFDTPSYLYKYDVYKIQLPRSSINQHNPQSVENDYNPEAAYIPGKGTLPPGCKLLGSVSVPSHHTDTLTEENTPTVDNQTCQKSPLIVVNRLENTKWHVVDDLTFPETLGLKTDNYYVLFTSPKGSRWKAAGTGENMTQCIALEYFVPKYTTQEQAALLNTIGIRFTDDETVRNTLHGVELFSFIPRYIMDPNLAKSAVKSIWKLDTAISSIEPQDLFKEVVVENLIHFSCPQYDCHNWYTEFATELARYLILDTFNSAMDRQFAKTLEPFSTSAEFNEQRRAVFHAFVSDAILGGFCLSSARRLLSDEMLPDDIQLPPPIGESFVHMRNSGTIRKASLPDMKTIPVAKLSDFDEKWALLFSSPMLHHDVSSATLMIKDYPMTEASGTVTTHIDNSATKCFMFYAKPLGGNNAGIDSVLLFFKIHEEQDEMKIDDICVMFIQSTLADDPFFGRTMSDLMFLWLTLLHSVYELSEQHIHPFVFFVKQPAVESFHLNREFPADSFIPQDNIWVMDGRTHELNEAILAHPGRLILSAATALQPNTNPTHFRCFFCDRIITEFFPSHHCQAILKTTREVQTMQINDLMTKYRKVTFDCRPHLTNQAPTEDESVPQIVFDLESTPLADPSTAPDEGQRDVIEINMVDVGGQRVSPFAVSPTPNEQEQTKLRFQVTQSHPIPNIFTYFARRPNALQPPQPTVMPMPAIPYKQEKAISLIQNELSNTASNLCTTVRLMNVWANKMRIGFGEDRRNDVQSMGAQHPPHEAFSALLENKDVPLAQLHLPMSFFPKQTLLLGTKQILTPFDIRGILSLVDKKGLNDRLKKIEIDKHIDKGQPLTEADARLVLSDKRMFSLLLASRLRSLGTRIPTLSSLPLYDIQSLVSFVNGTLMYISDTLGTCRSSLEHLSQPLVRTEAETMELNQMEMCLTNSFTVASRRLKQILQHKLLGMMSIPSDDVNMMVEGMKTNPLIPWCRRRHIIPFVIDVENCEEQIKLLSQSDKKLKRKDREICITVLLIHTPIEESEKRRLRTLINEKSKPTNHQEELISLVDNIGLGQDVNRWNQLLDDLEDKKKLDMSSRTDVQSYLEKPRGVSRHKLELQTLIEQAQFSDKDKDTLLSLVNGTPRFTSSRRKEIATLCYSNLGPTSEESCVKWIDDLKLDEENKLKLKKYVTASVSANAEEIIGLKKMIKEHQDLKQRSQVLTSLVDRNKTLSKSDRSLALSCYLTHITITKTNLHDLFRHFVESFYTQDTSSFSKRLYRYSKCVFMTNRCTSSNVSKKPTSPGKIWQPFFVCRMGAILFLCLDWVCCFQQTIKNR
ncbi:hypothetical protein BLNAU_13038 [Blattamonas nauphoetae]|uniref:Uncharacterized protein n=1 Tax=Blattamonas nauphoetae TaxID=2049346 RepID=A0ABQ9XHX9_9EUKA|nr:hypothetical protein BLNAU_13038 [Blattamonas nauphoetae]